MIKDNNTPQEQSAQEEALPESLDPDDLEASEMESISGGAPAPHAPSITCGSMLRCCTTSQAELQGAGQTQ